MKIQSSAMLRATPGRILQQRSRFLTAPKHVAGDP